MLERIRVSAGDAHMLPIGATDGGTSARGVATEQPVRAAGTMDGGRDGDVGGDTVDAATQLPPRGAGAADRDTQGGADATAGAGPGTVKRTSSG